MSMNKGFKISIALIASLLTLTAYSQDAPTFDKMVDFLPPAPNASAIIKYGSATLNKNTGTPNVSIPLFTLKGIKLSTSVSLGYSSSGIKVDEIASRVGMGWSINAGGVITRTTRGIPDETNVRHYPYATIALNWSTYMYMDRIADHIEYTSGGYDSEPDLFSFSFDGYSGAFVFDAAMQPKLINKSGLKILTNFGSSSWNFKMIAPDGTIYVFGGTGAVETTRREQSCGKAMGTFIPTAWYLKEIQHPNGETITLNYASHNYEYDNGVSQTMYQYAYAPPQSDCALTGTTTCTNITNTHGVLLQSIATGNSTIKFDYVSRTDCEDKLISRVVYYNSSDTIGSFNLNYTTVTSNSAYDNEDYTGKNKTPYLTSLVENSGDKAIHKTHYFSYNDPEGRPSRLSFSQDHWGYFNGKVNTTFVPNLGKMQAQYFPDATGNREPEFAYAEKGLLEKIVYPTGGFNQFFYEPNTYHEDSYYNTPHSLSCDVTGTGLWTAATKTVNFHIDADGLQEVTIDIACTASGGYDVIHNIGNVEIRDASSVVVYSHLCGPADPAASFSVLLGPGDYTMELSANGTVITTAATVHFVPEIFTSDNHEQIASGVRVGRIITSNPGETPMIKRYYYGTLDDLNTSSLSYISAKPEYISTFTCGSTVAPGEPVNSRVLNSSSLLNLGIFNGSNISYGSVVESIGDDFEGGATETKFYTGSDSRGTAVWNNDILNAPYNNLSSVYNAKPRSETIVQKASGGLLKPVKKTEYTYTEHPSADDIVYGYTVSRLENSTLTFDTTCDLTINPTNPGSCYWWLSHAIKFYNMVRYSVLSSFVYPSAVTETLYDENGENPVTTTTTNYYDELAHMQLTKSEQTNSRGQVIRTVNKYPHEYNTTSPYDDMEAANIIAPLVNSKTEIVNSPSNIPVSEVKVDYTDAGSSNYVPAEIKKSVKGNTLESEGTIDAYDSKGNILQFTSKAGITSAIIWGYNYQYPVAQIAGATYANATAELTVSMSALQSMDGSSLRTELNHIRTGLPAARVTTYTYAPQVGVTSITDPDNKTNTYIYDAFSRLLVVKDQDGNPVKKNQYVYAVPDSTAGITIYLNAAQSQSVSCTTCQPGYAPDAAVTYIVPAGKYYSLVSQTAADALATADMAANKQEYANRNSSCSNTATCTGAGYRFVNCACELGTKVLEECGTVQPNGTWYNYYHYLWSNGSTSSTFAELQAACTGNDKKKINCLCETGTKVCESTTAIDMSGNYTVSYHYLWSDASTSSTYTETFNCSGPDKKIINCTCVTGVKVYTASVACNGKTPPDGCCPGMDWLCTYHWHWPDGSNSGNYTECSETNCMPEALEGD